MGRRKGKGRAKAKRRLSGKDFYQSLTQIRHHASWMNVVVYARERGLCEYVVFVMK
jgi:hypothetical protein